MGTLWRDFEIPKKLVCDEDSLTDTYGRFVAEPFERGYGITVGNGLRRVLISSIEGAAVTSMRLDGVLHEFSAIPGVLEDVTQMVLNIKQLVLRAHSRQAKTIVLEKDKKGPVTAGDLEHDDTIEIINPELQLCTLTKAGKFRMELEVNRGRGYVPADRHKKEGQPIGVIPVDALFSPVQRVNFRVEDTRVGQVTDYDRLLLEIWTNGGMSPKEALLYASNIFQRHLDVFVNYGTLPDEPEEEKALAVDEEMEEKLKTAISELELSVRSANCLREAEIHTIGELVEKAPQDLLKYRNFGRKSLGEIEDLLKGMGLELGVMTGSPAGATPEARNVRHATRTQRLSRVSEQRKALVSGLVGNLVIHDQITTTHARAKEAQRLADRLVRLGKEGSIASRRRALRVLQDRGLVKRLFVEIAPRFTDVPSGYTRVLHTSRRLGDGAKRSVLAFSRLPAVTPPVGAKPTAPAPPPAPTAARPKAPPSAPPKQAEKPKGLFAGLKKLWTKKRAGSGAP